MCNTWNQMIREKHSLASHVRGEESQQQNNYKTVTKHSFTMC